MKPSRTHVRGIRAYQLGNSQIWITCLAARRIVGKYEPGRTQAFALDACKSVDAVERWANAARTYLTLRALLGKSSELVRKLHEARRQLWPGHFDAVGRAWARYEFEPRQALNYLTTCVQGRLSVEQLRDLMPHEPAGNGKRGVVLPVWRLSDGTVDILREQNPDARILIIDGYEGVDNFKVIPAKKESQHGPSK